MHAWSDVVPPIARPATSSTPHLIGVVASEVTQPAHICRYVYKTCWPLRAVAAMLCLLRRCSGSVDARTLPVGECLCSACADDGMVPGIHTLQHVPSDLCAARK